MAKGENSSKCKSKTIAFAYGITPTSLTRGLLRPRKSKVIGSTPNIIADDLPGEPLDYETTDA